MTDAPITSGTHTGLTTTTERKASAKFLITGGPGAGKTTFVGSVSEIDPLRTGPRGLLSSAPLVPSDAAPHPTTISLDFGRITIDTDLMLYLFGTPDQHRFGFMWDALANGALGGVVLADSRRLADCFYAVDYLEARSLPFVVAVNTFDGEAAHDLDDVRRALRLADDVLVLRCDAREKSSVKHVLLALFEIILRRMVDDADRRLAAQSR
ncbi:MAG: ATP/GTP-binding protein [Actinomycetota bacterium]